MSQRLNPLDASWLALDTADTPMHVGALLVFRKPKNAAPNYVTGLARQLREAEPAVSPWTLQLQRHWRNPLRAQWVESGNLDLSYHFHVSTLTGVGGERELGVLVAELHSAALDMSRPPWECHLIDGLHDEQFALYAKMHHSLMDVPGFMRLLGDSLSSDAGGAAQPPWAVTGISARAEAGEQFTQSLRDVVRPAQLLDSTRALGRAFGRQFRAALGRADGLRAPYTAPRSVLNTMIGPERRFATQQYAIARLEQVADACDVTLNELVLYLCGSVLRRFFKEYNALPDAPLIAAVPAQRADDDESYGSIGFVSLATHLADPAQRLSEIRESARASREHLDALPNELVPLYTLVTAGPYLLAQASGLARFAPAFVNVAIATLDGSEEPLHFGGARLQAMYPMFPLTQGHALTISAMSYAASLDVGFCGASETLPSLQRMAVYMERALEDLEERIAIGEIA